MKTEENGILKTVVYYNCLDYPLTKEELNIFSFRDKGGQGADLVEESDGLYFLNGRKSLVKIRTERNKIAKKKWDKTLKAIKWLRIIPYIKLVFASGSLALSNTDEESDLDVLIVVKHGRIWTARILTVLLLSLLGVRRTRYERIAPDKICLNHFITDKSLYIPRKSIYTAQLYARLVPIFIEDKKLVDDFIKANSWIGEWVRGWPTIKFKITDQNLKVLRTIKKIGEKILDTKFGDWLERTLKKYQLRRINSYYLTHRPGGRVKADDESLEFHPDSPELIIIERYNRKMIELGFKDLTEETSF